MNIALIQFAAQADPANNAQRIQIEIARAKTAGADMVCFPEYSMGYQHTRTSTYFQSIAAPLDGAFVSALQESAARHQIWVGAGVMEQTDGLPYNTYVILDNCGHLVATHRKNMLYDAFGARESAECQAGCAPFAPFATPFGTLGIITCYELRFPALAAGQRAQGADLLLVPAGWMAGEHKVLHWETLLRARAIENGMTVLGINQWAQDIFTGYSAAYAPNGVCLGALGAENEMLLLSL